jgi:uncharacterized repeat protein (TIGR01451 family)
MSLRRWRGFGACGCGAALVIAACSGVGEPKDGAPDDDAGGAAPGPSGGKAAGAEAGSPGGESGNAGAGSPGAGAPTGGTDSGGGSGKGGGGGASGEADGGSGDPGDGGTGSGGTASGPLEPTYRGRTGSLVLQVSVAQSPAIVGQTVLYTLTIGNTSTIAVKGVELLYRIPKGLQMYYSYALPPSSTCGNGYCTENEEATWTLDIPAGGMRSIQFEPSVLDVLGEGDTITPQIRLSAPGLDPLTLSPELPVVAGAPVELTLGADAEPLIAGEELELSVDLGHIGAAGVFAGKLLLEFPSWLDVTDVSDGGVSTEDDIGRVTWDIAAVPVGTSFRRLVKARVRAEARAGEVLNPRATFTHEDATTDHVARLALGVVGKSAPLELEITAASDPVVPGGMATYFATVSNTSQRAVDGVTLYHRVPADESFYYTLVEPNSSSCGNGYCTGGELAVWDLGTLGAGASETITIPASVVAQVAGDGALVSAAFQVDALNVTSLRRFKTVAAHAKPSAQLVLGTVFSPVTPGQTFTYDVDVGQIGLGSLQASVLELELPPGVTAQSPSDSGTVDGARVVWNLGAVGVAQTRHRSVQVTVPEATAVASILKGRATLSFTGGQERDVVSELALPIAAETLPLSATLAATPNPVVLGNTVSFTTTLKNTAERTLDGVSLLLRMPTGHSFYYTTGADPDSSSCGNGYCTDDEEAVWALGSMAAGSTKIVNVNPTVDTALTAGSLVTYRQRLTAVELGGTILLQTTLPTKK